MTDRDVDRVLASLGALFDTFQAPRHDRSLSTLLPSTLRRSTRRAAGLLFLPDRPMLRRALDHPVVDRLIAELITRILTGYVQSEGAREVRGSSLLARVPLSRVTGSLTDTVLAGITTFTQTRHQLVLDYLIDTLTTVEHLPDFAAWRVHMAEVLWTTPLAEVIPQRKRHLPASAQVELAEVARELRAELSDRSLLDVLVSVGFDRSALLEAAAVLDEVLSSRSQPRDPGARQ